METNIISEVPGEMPKRRHLRLLPAMINEVPGYEGQPSQATAASHPDDGEYHGGDLDVIARRSGLSTEVVGKAALESVLRQLHQL